MNSSVYRVSLDIHKAESQAVLDMKKRDADSRQIQISLTENGKPYYLTPDCSAVFTAKKPDGKAIYNECTIKDNLIIYDVTDQTTAVVGRVDSEIRLQNDEGKLLTCPRFVINVNGTVCDDDDIISTDEVNALQKLINEVSDIIEAIKNGESTHTHSNKNVLDELSVSNKGDLLFNNNPVSSEPNPSLPPIEVVIDNAEGYISIDLNTQTMSFETLKLPVNARVVKVEIPDVVNGTNEYIQLEDMIAKDPMGIGAPYFVIYPKNAQNIFTIAAVVIFPSAPNGFFEAASAYVFINKTIKIYYEIEEN